MLQMTLHEPKPLPDEPPAAYAYRVSQWYLSWNKPDKALGQFFTPLPVARFMAELLPIGEGSIRVLDAGAGIGILSCALCEVANGDVELEAYEIDRQLADYLDTCLSYAQLWMKSKDRCLRYSIIRDDFILAQGDALNNSPSKPFDVVVSNPPYFKIAKTDPRTQMAARVVHGQPNIYALFMAVSAALLCPDGYAVFITPRSYAAGQYFSRFRQYFFNQMRPRAFHLFDSRREVFDEVLQESLITLAQRSARDKDVVLSSSVNFDFSHVVRRTKSIEEILDADNVLHLPLSEQDDAIAEVVRAWHGSLHQYGMEISTGPVVPFRAANLVMAIGDVPSTHAPLLWMQNIKPMRWEWPTRHKGQYLRLEGASKLLLPNQNYVLLRRFSAKEERQRLTAAPYLANLDTPVIGLENHLNYIHRPHGCLTPDETRGLAVLLNSTFMDSYFRISNGNTQVSATELRKLPLPPLDAIAELGRLAVYPDVDVDTLTAEVLGLYA
jgi:adenine-specific DNA-methyltransferase